MAPHNQLERDMIRSAPSDQPEIYRVQPVFDPTTLRPGGSPLFGARGHSEFVSLCTDFDEARFPKRAVIEPKVDGWRAFSIGRRHGGIRTREGNALPAAALCQDAIEAIEAAFGKPMFLDGEIAHCNGFEATARVCKMKRPSTLLVFWLFDAVPLDVWAAGRRTAPLHARQAALAEVMARVQHPNVGMLASLPLDLGGARQLVNGFWQRGLEGVVVKDADGEYLRGRNPGWMRWKQQHTMDVPVFGLAPAGGPHTTAVCYHDGREYRVSIPTDAADELWPIVQKGGATIEISHNGFTSKGTPRHAQFVRVRADKVMA